MSRTALLLQVLIVAGCGDPLGPRPAPEIRAMVVFSILSPGDSIQAVSVRPVTPEDLLEEVTVAVYRGGELIATGVPAADTLSREESFDIDTPCYRSQYVRCFAVFFTPDFGATYRLVVAAEGRPTATATTTVPGDFEVLDVRAQGTDPPGSEGLFVRWTRSESAYRYLVALRATVPPWCVEYGPECTGGGTRVFPDRDGWYAVSKDTVLETTISGRAAEEIAAGKGPWYVDVYAMSKGLFQYLTTGTSSDLFSVPPVQNVEGGYGAMGAWVVRTMKIKGSAPNSQSIASR